MVSETRFILNDQEIRTAEPPGMLVLDFLRRRATLMGTKEGCKEGDCGACTVLIGESHQNTVRYQPETSCLIPLGELQGKHLVTVEGLNMDHLSLVQQAIVDEGGTQCGFCTPGIVVSLTAALLEKGAAVTDEDIKYALGGHLCRCTGYASLKRAGKLISGNSSILGTGEDQWQHLRAMVKEQMLPGYFTDIPMRLKAIHKESRAPRQEASKEGKRGPGIMIAGGTDIYVQRGTELPGNKVAVLNLYPDMKGIAEREGQVHLGALTTFEEFAAHALIQKIIPEMQQYMHLIASWQIRNRATLGGNIINASPIGDMTILLLALDTSLVLRDGSSHRTVPMKEFFKGYKQLDKTPAEILTEMIFPLPSTETRINFEKVSKRKCLDIASVNSAIKITVENRRIKRINLTMGGVAAVPLFMRYTGDFLTGKTISVETLEKAFAVAREEISPISDIRGQAEYKELLVRQLIIAHFSKLFPEYLTVKDFAEILLV